MDDRTRRTVTTCHTKNME